MNGEKQKVAFSSVIAAVFLTLVKIIVGVTTGSLGILSEAAHSALDLGAAVVTFFAVRISDKPADMEHNYGHGKVESFSALIETLLLLVTCAWIIDEAVKRLFLGELVSLKVSETLWGIGIMILSIAINITRAKVLRKAAKKYGSQALEADALHFDTDVWSSYVVIAGLLFVGIGDYFKIPFMKYGDPIAALGVSALVITVSIKLGKRTIDALLDTAPKGMVSTILHEVNGVKGVLDVENARVRPSGANYFIDISVGIARNESHRVVHSIVDEIRNRLQKSIPNSDIVISTFPVDVSGMEDREVYHTVKKIVDKFPVCTNIHNIHVYEVSGKKFIAIHIEVKECMSLNESHGLSHTIGNLIQEAMDDVQDVSVNFEYVEQQNIHAEDITGQSGHIIDNIYELIKQVPEKPNCHDIKIYSRENKLTIFLHCELEENYSIEKTEQISKGISNMIREGISDVEAVHIHVEPVEG
ncbi:MAG: cation diffusion facilitator family transporter [Bacillota bacterium]|nr:cation diffusion facilitator family transporter [Bacillota bacterium]